MLTGHNSSFDASLRHDNGSSITSSFILLRIVYGSNTYTSDRLTVALKWSGLLELPCPVVATPNREKDGSGRSASGVSRFAAVVPPSRCLLSTLGDFVRCGSSADRLSVLRAANPGGQRGGCHMCSSLLQHLPSVFIIGLIRHILPACCGFSEHDSTSLARQWSGLSFLLLGQFLTNRLFPACRLMTLGDSHHRPRTRTTHYCPPLGPSVAWLAVCQRRSIQHGPGPKLLRSDQCMNKFGATLHTTDEIITGGGGFVTLNGLCWPRFLSFVVSVKRSWVRA